NYPLMWAMFGIAREPPEGVDLRGLADGKLLAWQYAGARDTVIYSRSSGESERLIAEVRQAGTLIGRAETTFGSDGTPVKARLTVPSAPEQLDLTFLASLSVLSLNGCLYGFSGGGLPPGIKTVAVLPFDNQTPEPTLTQEISRA